MFIASWLALATLGGQTKARAEQALRLGADGPGRVFEGVGAVSGGGATSVLLKDYPEPQRGQVLDLLFKPMFAASMQTLYVEVGSDGNATQGPEPTHMRTRTDENYFRGYEWWLMKEAVARNPTLTLDACAWGAPGWVGNGQFWSQDMADYYVKWIKALKSVHGLELDAVGCRNEKGVSIAFPKIFRKTLNAAGLQKVRLHAFDNPGKPGMWDWLAEMRRDPELAASVDILGNHVLTNKVPPPTIEQRMGKTIWNTEEHPYSAEGRVFKDDYDVAIGIVHLFNTNYIEVGATKIVNWYLVASTYANEPYASGGAMIAREPWTGHYAIKPAIWGYAHYGQFTKLGWTYVDSGCQALSDGGSVVTLRDQGGDYSVIAETRGATKPQTLTFTATQGLKSGPLCVWRTTRKEQFVRQADLSPTNGAYTLVLEPDAIYSISTTTGQQKGTFENVPASRPFPASYVDDFESYGNAKQWGYLPRYTADICGVFELADRPGGGHCLKQVVTQKANSWAPEWLPYTVFGNDAGTDMDVSADISVERGGWAGVMARVASTGDGYNGVPAGYYARLTADGGCELVAVDPALKGIHQRQLAAATVAKFKRASWHNIQLRARGPKLTVFVDGVEVLSAQSTQYAKGLAGLVCAGQDDARFSALFDNITLNPLNTATPATTPIMARPLYP